MISFLGYKLGAGLSRYLPHHASDTAVRAIAASQYHLRAGARANVLANLRVALGPEADGALCRRTAQRVFDNFGRSIYYFLRSPYITSEEIRRRCDYAGMDGVVESLSRKGGFIVAGSHVGPWEIAGVCLSALGLGVHTVALDHPSARVTEFFQERRRRAGIVSYPLGGSFANLSAALHRGECVALLVDRAYGRSRRSFPMFGRDVMLPTGHAALAVRCRVPVLTAVCVFAPEGRFSFEFRGPYFPDPSLTEEAAAGELHRICREDVEHFIREYPDQWFNFERFGGLGCNETPRQ